MTQCYGDVPIVFVGGSGRSGTSYVAKSLCENTGILGFEDVELKIFSELGGLLDLYSSIVENYSLVRARTAIKGFSRLFNSLYGDSYQDQFSLHRYVTKSIANEYLEGFLVGISQGDTNYPRRCAHALFSSAAHNFLHKLFGEYAEACEFGGSLFLEKTPHNTLHCEFLNNIVNTAFFVNVVRDPRSVCWSLKKMNWGPDDLLECIEWYKCYSSAWAVQKMKLSLSGIEVFDFSIEYLSESRNRGVIEHALTGYLRLNESVEFRNFDVNGLNNWAKSVPELEMSILSSKLEPEIIENGYDMSVVGQPVGALYKL